MAAGDDRTQGVAPAEEVLYSIEDGVATLTINRPAKRNSMTQAVVTGLRRRVAEAKADPNVRVLVLTGAGEKAFCSGVDLSGGADGGFLGDHAGRGELPGLFTDLFHLGKPTVARVRGFALAGGFGLALACDMVVAAADAQFGAPEANVGLWPFVITVPLARSMPPKKALELMMTGRRVDAEEAAGIGFVNRVVPVAALDGAVAELAGQLASASPIVMKMGRDSFYSVWDLPAEAALAHLHAQLSLTTLTEDAREGMAAFNEKRPPVWKGR
jgi:enoyl-CoA hydratase/carnithine racemase